MSKGLRARKLFYLRVFWNVLFLCVVFGLKSRLFELNILPSLEKVTNTLHVLCAQEFVEDSDPKTHERLMMVAAGTSPKK
jgi:hypothetical protein